MEENSERNYFNRTDLGLFNFLTGRQKFERHGNKYENFN